MPDDFQQSPRIKKVKRDAIYNYYEASPTQPPTPIIAPMPPPRPVRWGWVGGIGAVVALVGTLATTQLNAQKVYYCASHNTVKYHTDATCSALLQCSAKVRSMPLGKAKAKMELCKACH